MCGSAATEKKKWPKARASTNRKLKQGRVEFGMEMDGACFLSGKSGGVDREMGTWSLFWVFGVAVEGMPERAREGQRGGLPGWEPLAGLRLEGYVPISLVAIALRRRHWGALGALSEQANGRLQNIITGTWCWPRLPKLPRSTRPTEA